MRSGCKAANINHNTDVFLFWIDVLDTPAQKIKDKIPSNPPDQM